MSHSDSSNPGETDDLVHHDERTDSYRLAVSNPTANGSSVAETSTDTAAASGSRTVSTKQGQDEGQGSDVARRASVASAKRPFDSEQSAAHLQETMLGTNELSSDDLSVTGKAQQNKANNFFCLFLGRGRGREEERKKGWGRSKRSVFRLKLG